MPNSEFAPRARCTLLAILLLLGAGMTSPRLVTASAIASSAASSAAAPWWNSAVIYEIYPRSFQDSDGDGIGDLKGVTQRLDYLKRLGVDAIWLTPFFPSPNFDFGYDVSDYTDVGPEYGTLADWDELVREADKRGIRILVDFVVNHTSEKHPWFKESRSSRDNPRRDWYVWRDGKNGEPPNHWLSIFGGYTWTLDPTTGQWYYHIFAPQQPDLNWRSPGVRAAMFDVARFWLRRGASGFRLDATPYLYEDPEFPEDPSPQTGAPVWLKPYNAARPETHDVLRELRAVLDGFPGAPVLLGESTTQSIEDLAAIYGKDHDEIQLPMDFMFGGLHALDAAAFKKQVDAAQLQLGGQTPVFFFSSHDHHRQWSSFGDGPHNDRIAKLTAALTLTQRGAVLLYYGEEIGMGDLPAGALENFPLGPKRPRADARDVERAPMQWTGGPGAGFTTGAPWLPIDRGARRRNVAAQQATPGSIYRWYSDLLRLRHEQAAFREGEYVPLDSGNPKVFAFARRTSDGQGALVVLNASGERQTVRITGLTGKWPRFGGTLLTSPGAPAPATPHFKIAPFGSMIAEFQPRR